MSRLGGILKRFRQLRTWPDLRATDDWQRGDLAVCTGNAAWADLDTGRLKDGPNCDDILRVREVAVRRGFPFLTFETWPRDRFAARHFLKITPRQDEACKPAFAQQMKRLRPTVDA